MKRKPVSHLRRNLIRGVVLILPLLVTVWLLSLLFDVIHSNVTPWVREVLIWAGIPGLERWFARLGIPIIGLLLTLLFVYLVGLLGGNLAGRRLLTAIETGILRIPLVRSVYGSARQLLDAFSVTGEQHFSRVVAVEYPRRGLWTIGFVTREARHDLGDRARGEAGKLVPVFLPTTPNPTSGWMLLSPVEELIELSLSIEDGLKLVVSGGIVSPDDLARYVVDAGGVERTRPS